MKAIFQEFATQIVTAFLGIILVTSKEFLQKNLSKFYWWIIKSRFTPRRMTYQEEEAMKLGVTTGIISAKSRIFATNIYVFSIHKNGRDTFRQHLRANDKSELDGYETQGFEKVIEELKEKHFINIENTSKPQSDNHKMLCDVLQSIGYRGVNLILIENKYKVAFFLVVHKDFKTTSYEDVDYLKKSLLKFRDPIVTLYLKSQ